MAYLWAIRSAKRMPSVGADLAEGDLPLLQPLDQEGAGHIEQISGLLGGQLGVHRQQCHSIALGHLHQDLLQQPQNRSWEGNGCALAAFQLKAEAGLPQGADAPVGGTPTPQ
jgi:hypothetical protein